MRVFHRSKFIVCFLPHLSLAFALFLASFPGNAAGQAKIGKGPPSSAILDDWKVTAKKPEYVDEDLIIGSFEFERLGGDAETRGGGACLVADLNDKYPCDTREDCLQAQADGYVKPTPPGGYIYCQALNGQKHKRCWTRPSAGGCTRSPSRYPGTYETTPVSALVDGQPVMWMTAACLAAEGYGTGCGSSDPALHIYATSPPLESEGEEDVDSD